MQTPEVAVFDLGKVLVDFDYGIAIKKIAARCPNGRCDLDRLLHESTLLSRYETGQLSTSAFYLEARAASGFAGNEEEFGELFGDIFSPMQPMIDLHGELRRRGVPTYIFSNTNELAVRHIRRRFPFFSTFTGYVLSYEHGSMKPEAKIYDVVEAQTGKRGGQIVYLDDRPENVAAGSARGWQTILHQEFPTSRAALAAMGLMGVSGLK